MDNTSPTTIYQIDNILHHRQASIDIINTTLSSHESILASHQSDIAEIKSILRSRQKMLEYITQAVAEISSKISQKYPSPLYAADEYRVPPTPLPFIFADSTTAAPPSAGSTAAPPYFATVTPSLLPSSLNTPSQNITSLATSSPKSYTKTKPLPLPSSTASHPSPTPPLSIPSLSLQILIPQPSPSPSCRASPPSVGYNFSKTQKHVIISSTIIVNDHRNQGTTLYSPDDNLNCQQIASVISNHCNKSLRWNFRSLPPRSLLEKLTIDLAQSNSMNMVSKIDNGYAVFSLENDLFCLRKQVDSFSFIQQTVYAGKDDAKSATVRSPEIRSPIINTFPPHQESFNPYTIHLNQCLLISIFGIISISCNLQQQLTQFSKLQLGTESEIYIFDPGGALKVESIFDLEDKVDFEGTVMIRLYMQKYITVISHNNATNMRTSSSQVYAPL